MCYLFKILAMLCCMSSQRQGDKQNLSAELLQKVKQQKTFFNKEAMQQWLANKNEEEQEEVKRKGVSWIVNRLDKSKGWAFPDRRYVEALQWLLAQGSLIDQGEYGSETSSMELLCRWFVKNHEVFKAIFIDNDIVIPATVLNKMGRNDYIYWRIFSDPFLRFRLKREMTELPCVVLRYLLANGLDIYTPARRHLWGIYEANLINLQNKCFSDQIVYQNRQTIKEIIEDFLIHQQQGNLENSLHDRRLADVIILSNN